MTWATKEEDDKIKPVRMGFTNLQSCIHCVRPYLFLKQVQALGAGNRASSACVDCGVIDRVTGDRRQVDAAATPKAERIWKSSSRVEEFMDFEHRPPTKIATAQSMLRPRVMIYSNSHTRPEHLHESISRQTRWMESRMLWTKAVQNDDKSCNLW